MVHWSYGVLDEVVSEPCGAGPDEQFVARVLGVSDDSVGLLPAPRGGEVLHGFLAMCKVSRPWPCPSIFPSVSNCFSSAPLSVLLAAHLMMVLELWWPHSPAWAGGSGEIWACSPEGHQCWESGWRVWCCLSTWPGVYLSGSSWSLQCWVPGLWVCWQVWWAQWYWMQNYSQWAAISHMCSSGPDTRGKCEGLRRWRCPLIKL